MASFLSFFGLVDSLAQLMARLSGGGGNAGLCCVAGARSAPAHFRPYFAVRPSACSPQAHGAPPLHTPLHTPAQAVDAVGQGVALAGVAVAAGKHNGLNAAVQLGQGHLHSRQSRRVVRRREGVARSAPAARPRQERSRCGRQVGGSCGGSLCSSSSGFARPALPCPPCAPAARPAQGARPARCPATPRWSGTPGAATPGRAR
mgnify:CR=1 FL=1